MKMAKALFLICAGILMLVVALDIGTEEAWADFDPEAGGPVVAYGPASALLANGECWGVTQAGWTRKAEYDPPIPVAEIAFWESSELIATNGDYWYSTGSSWINVGGPPGGVATQSTTWSGLKRHFKE